MSPDAFVLPPSSTHLTPVQVRRALLHQSHVTTGIATSDIVTHGLHRGRIVHVVGRAEDGDDAVGSELAAVPVPVPRVGMGLFAHMALPSHAAAPSASSLALAASTSKPPLLAGEPQFLTDAAEQLRAVEYASEVVAESNRQTLVASARQMIRVQEEIDTAAAENAALERQLARLLTEQRHAAHARRQVSEPVSMISDLAAVAATPSPPQLPPSLPLPHGLP